MADTINIDGFRVRPNDGRIMYISPDVSPPDQLIAVKILRTIEGNHPETSEQYLSMMDHLRQQMIPKHPNICQMQIKYVIMNKNLIPAIVMSAYGDGNIFDVTRRNLSVDTLSLVNGAAEGLAYLHSKGISHGNIHPNNILVSENGQACISDVGVQALTCTVAPKPSSWFYRSPDALDQPIFSMEEDVYCFACTVFVMYNRSVPFEPNPTAYEQGLQCLVEQGIIGRPKSMSQTVWELLQECWESDSSKRPTMQRIRRTLSFERRCQKQAATKPCGMYGSSSC